jgi:hypothetical protein
MQVVTVWKNQFGSAEARPVVPVPHIRSCSVEEAPEYGHTSLFIRPFYFPYIFRSVAYIDATGLQVQYS